MNSNERYELPVTKEEHELIKVALEEYYLRALKKIEKVEERFDEEKGRDVRTTRKLAFIQETVQYVTLVYNIKTGKLNEDLATPDNFGFSKQDGNPDGQTVSS